MKKYQNWIIGGLMVLILLMVYTCEKDKIIGTKTTVEYKDTIVKLPEQNGGFDKPTNVSEIPSQGKDSIRYIDRIVYVESKVNQETVEKYKKAKDTIAKLNAFLDAVRERDYVTNFEDDFVAIKANIKVDGTLKDTKLDYKLKPREVTVQEKIVTKETVIEKKDNFGVLAGAGFLKNIDNQKNAYELSGGVRVGKISIMATANTEKQVGARAVIEF